VVLWDRWISELVADFWSVAKLGVSSTLGLIQVLSLPRAFVFHLHPTDPHPFAWIRVHASCAMVHALFPHPQWAGVATFWDQLYPLRNSSALGALTRRLRDHTAIFAEEMAGHRPRALRGQSLREALAVDQRTPGHLLEIYRSNAANPSALAALPPTLGTAALGQAKFGDLLSPEEESALHANLLKSWALARALNITTANLPTRRLLREVA
jgi:hypothetical protein